MIASMRRAEGITGVEVWRRMEIPWRAEVNSQHLRQERSCQSLPVNLSPVLFLPSLLMGLVSVGCSPYFLSFTPLIFSSTAAKILSYNTLGGRGQTSLLPPPGIWLPAFFLIKNTIKRTWVEADLLFLYYPLNVNVLRITRKSSSH